VSVALTNLNFIPKRATLALVKLIESAVANATNNHGLAIESLIVKEIRVDGGSILYRRMPRARGSAYPIRKRTSSVRVVLESRAEAVKKTSKKTK
jgi:large subunit ribosomal protein L22